MLNAVAKVRERCERASRALDAANIPYAVVGGNAVANWVASVDEGAVRNTRDVDILLSRADLDHAKVALANAGFDYAVAAGVHRFIDGTTGLPSDGVHIVFAGENVLPEHLAPAPGIAERERGTAFQVVTLEALVRMKIVAYRLKDQVHLQDLARVGLIDSAWLPRFPESLAKRLQHILENPDA
jgi:hypothetical protein